MPQLIESTYNNRTYDFAVYLLKCNINDSRPAYEDKYIATSDHLSGRKRFNRVPRKYISPKSSRNLCRVHKKVITNKDNTDYYPLSEELANEANNIYYVGRAKSQGLYKRIKQHIQPSQQGEFMRKVTHIELLEVLFCQKVLDRRTLLETLDAELYVELANSSRRVANILSEYDKIAQKIHLANQVTIDDLKRWKEIVKSSGMNRSSFAALESHAKEMDLGSFDAERKTATEHMEVNGKTENGNIRPDRIDKYVYWH
ncbi:hypothetical protein [Natronorubrum sp. FCH18a]|uniref:hypothetical protein n=1 Tax=Natronorubrum sp. FCH18a TaxID=3447018 RepID=UPI003F51950A